MLKAMLNLINQQKQKSKKGFTLVELIVVIAILGILAALVVPQVTGYIEKAQESTDQANAQMLYTAGQLYLTDLEVGGTKITDKMTFDQDKLISGGYIQKMPGGSAKFLVTGATDKTDAADAAKAKLTMTYTSAKGTIITLPEGATAVK